MKLLIVESPGKIKTIKKYLGEGWQVEASIGHIRDLPVKSLGVDLQNYKPQYEPTERGAERIKILKNLAQKASEVYLATDPDREGEAIAWHLQEALGLKNPKRITFSEITEKAVKAAVAAPRALDMHLVQAQEARRVLDRLVGYPVSQALARVVGKGSSAGRVQSPAVKIVVERERAISNFKVTTHYGVEVTFEALENVNSGWTANWKTKDFLETDSEYILSKELAEKVAALKYYIVTNFEDSEAKQAPAAPFTTSTLQQAASKKLKFSPKKTMELAQKLYEAGHITYMRTDSPNLSAEAIADIQEFCRSNNLPAADKPRTWKSKDSAQEAHEAIRPSKVELESAGENPEQEALYKLIRVQAIASQMADALFAVRKVQLQSEEMLDDKAVTLEATGKTLLAPGWKTILAEPDEEESSEGLPEAQNPIPELRPESRLLAQSSKVQTKQTKPPVRFTEASLVKQLENAGIGRPATYAAILENIITYRGYLVIDKKRNLLPTEAGYAVVDHMNEVFCFMNLDFTKGMEESLDDVASGKNNYDAVVRSVNGTLSQELKAFQSKHSFPCPECGQPLIHRIKAEAKGVKGYDFWGCSGYPECSYSANNDNNKPGVKIEKRERVTPVLSEFECKACGKSLIRKQGTSKNGKQYDFFGCSGYPNCKETYWTKDDKPYFEKA